MDTFLNEKQFEEIFESHIKIESYSKSIDSLINSGRSKEKIDYKPYYQRNYVWDDSKASYFIESILLGTEIPPLIFFDEAKKTEVIDGRQRFETIKRFMEGEFSLSKNGLTTLVELAKMNIESLRVKMPTIYEAFLDAKVRIIGFKLVNNPPSDPILIDKIKKEIFGRYNSGITPLKKAEIDNAVYNSDKLSTYFKNHFKKDASTLKNIGSLFLRQIGGEAETNIESAMQFVRKSLVIHKFPIKTYAGGKSRTELISKFYEFTFSELEDPDQIYKNYLLKLSLLSSLRKSLQNEGVVPNRLFFECLLWAVNVIEQEGVNVEDIDENKLLLGVRELCIEKGEIFDLTDSHYGKETVKRYEAMSKLFEEIYKISFSPYIRTEESPRELLSKINPSEQNYKKELEKLETLRITKPDPSRNTIEDLLRMMKRNRFLVRPSYQRSEVINLAKSSAIIESILLGIMLPAIFIYKRMDGVSEVIDGQQRLLTILGFIGEKYLDENNNFAYSKNHQFKLRNPKILRKLKGSKFSEINENLRDKILEFDLFVVEIEERLNPEFDPVDLFIRLNDKPFPIRENSFEMWNSWADKDVIDQIKIKFNANKEWLYIKKTDKRNYRDRMNNEELYTTLAFFDYQKNKGKDLNSYLDIYSKGGRINARIKKKQDITQAFLDVYEWAEEKDLFLASLESVGGFVAKVQLLLGGAQEDRKEVLDRLISSGTARRYYSRKLQDFYILWRIIGSIEVTKSNRDSIYTRMVDVYSFMKNIPEEYIENNTGYIEFENMVNEIIDVN